MKATDTVAAAYDAIAPEYDFLVVDDGWMRRALWQYCPDVFQGSQRVRDVVCGTGLDSLSLARQDIAVTAVDISAGMGVLHPPASRLSASLLRQLGLAEKRVNRYRSFKRLGHFSLMHFERCDADG